MGKSDSERNASAKKDADYDIETQQNVTLSQANEILGDLTSGELRSSIFAEQRDEAQRFELSTEIARGGMGAVHLGHDHRLGRDLAIKILLESQSEDAASLQRFVEEAQIGGQLQHPGIVPVYDLGMLSDGRPFLAMKLVKGQTLAALLRERDDVLRDRERFLSIFEQVCQTLAYAHAKSVVHRDLKPANIMVGAFGEVQVMDWGLAKVLTDEPKRAEDKPEQEEYKTIIQTIRTSEDESGRDSASHTRSGSVLGTLAYMPPEQAMGQVELLDTRADVFALGAILCHVLTGKPPYVSKDSSQLHRMAIKCDLEDCFSRLEECACGHELKEIVHGCLAEEPTDRFEHAGKVAARLRKYMASVSDRLRQSEVEKAASEARAAEAVKTAAVERKRRRVTGAFAALAGCVLVAAAGAAFWIQRNRVELASAKNDAKLNELLRQQESNQRVLSQQQQVNEELAIAESLLDKANTSEPTIEQLNKALDAAKRAEVLFDTSEVTPEVMGRFEDVVAKHAKLTATVHWLNELTSIRIGATERSLQQNYYRVHSSERETIERVNHALPIDEVQASFQQWGIKPSDSAKTIQQQIESLPVWAAPSIVIAMRFWSQALGARSRFEQMMDREWTVLRNGRLESDGGATLTEQPDGSILASGKNPNCDVYTFEFSLDDQDFSALRIEALPDRSMPNRGLGRSVNGDATMTDLRLSVLANGTEEELSIGCAEADYCFAGEPLQRNQWNLTFAQGEPRTAIFFLDGDFNSGVQAQSSAERTLRIVIHNHNVEQWGDQNLGRIRLSIDHGKSTDQQVLQETLDQVITNLPQDAWESEFWDAYNARDVERLLALARDKQTVTKPDAFLILLGATLNELGERYYVRKLIDGANWDSVEPGSITGDADFDYQSDGSIIVSRHEDNNSVYVVDWPKFGAERGIPKAIRIDTINSGDTGGPGTGSGADGCQISDLRVVMENKETNSYQYQSVVSIASDHRPQLDGRAFLAIDGDRSTCWKVDHPVDTKTCSAILELDPREDFEFGERLYLYIYTGQWISDTTSMLRHFRISWTYELPQAEDPREVAIQMLRNAYLHRPNNDRLMLSLARQMLLQATPDFQEAMGYATAAVALRPDDPATLNTFVRLVLLQQPNPKTPLYQRAIGLARRSDRVTGTTETIDGLIDEWIAIGDRQFSGRTYSMAADSYLHAYELAPDRFRHFDRIGFSLDAAGRDQQAEYFYRLGLEQMPDDSWTPSHYGAMLASRGDFDDALEKFNRSLKINPHDISTLSRKATLLTYLRRWTDANATYEEYRKNGGQSYYNVIRNALTLVRLGNQEDALELVESQWENKSYGSGIRDLLLLTLQLEGEQAMKDRFTQACEEKESSPGLLDRGIRYPILKSGGCYSFPYSDAQVTERYVLHDLEQLLILADLLVDHEPKNGSFHRVRAMTLFELDRYEEAADAAQKTLDLTSVHVGIEPFILAVNEHKHGDPERAIELYLQAEEKALPIKTTYTRELLAWVRECSEIKDLRMLAGAKSAPE